MSPHGQAIENVFEPDTRPASSRWIGFVDRIESSTIFGWCADCVHLDKAIAVEIVASNGNHFVTTANHFRPDLRDAGYGNGQHGFAIDVTKLKLVEDDTVILRFYESKVDISKAPISFSPHQALLRGSLPPSFVGLLQDLAAEIRTRAAELPDTTAAIAPRGWHGPRKSGDAIFAARDPATDPEGLISKYVAFECNRLVRDQFNFQMAGNVQDRLSILIWYLTSVSGHRQNRVMLPLSAQQIAYFNQPAAIAGASPAVTIGLLNMVLAERPDLANLKIPQQLSRALYWWCVERAPQIQCEDCLVTPEQVAALREETQWFGEEFPFNRFLTEYFNAHVELHVLDMNIMRDRAAFFYYMVLRAFETPSLLRFLPRDTLNRALTSNSIGFSPFDEVVGRHALDGASSQKGQQIRKAGEALAASAGFSLYHDIRQTQPRDSGECFVRRRSLDTPIENGIAVVGPIRKTSGLGQATRLSYDVLRAIEKRTPTVLAFDLDNPAPVGFASDQSFSPYENRRAINLIHLNAESIPLAFAFEQREIFAESYNIGYFFWELNQIPKCHRLALELLDEVWVSSDYNREIYSRFTDKPVVNVGMAVEALPMATPLDRAALGLARDAFVFLTTFDSFSFIERKNPLGVLEAFKTAFPLGTENVQLVVKTQNRTRVSDPYQIDVWRRIDRVVATDPRIIVINETYKYRDLLGLKLACDCYVSLHRSEGWGFGMIEAMQLGRPVIATAYSGNMEFCTPDTAFLVGYDLQGVREAEYIFVERGSEWAAPRLDEAAARLRAAAADPAAARAKGIAAAAFVKAKFSVEAIGKRYKARLAEVRAKMPSA